MVSRDALLGVAAVLLTTVATVSLSSLLLPASATAQSRAGLFEKFNTWWINPDTGLADVSFNGSKIVIVQDGGGVAEYNVPFNLPLGTTVPSSNLRLSPSREILYAFGGVCQTGGTWVYFYSIPPPPGSTLGDLVFNHCIPEGILAGPFFFDTGICDVSTGGAAPGLGLLCDGKLGHSPRRHAYIVTHDDPLQTNLNIHWFWFDGDLAFGVGTTIGDHKYSPALDFPPLTVAPSGTFALAKHGLPDPTSGPDYTLIDLCNLQIVNRGGFPLAGDKGSPQGTDLTGRVVSVDAAAGTIRVAVEPLSGSARLDEEFTDCVRAQGACCSFDGSCHEFGIESDCGPSTGVWLGVDSSCSACPAPPSKVACCGGNGSFCLDLVEVQCDEFGYQSLGEGTSCAADLCPIVDLMAVVSGNDTAVNQGGEITYVLGYSNDGEGDASNALLQASMPNGTEFVSATGGGDEQSGQITWNLGNLAGLSSNSVSFTVRTGCETADITYGSDWVSIFDDGAFGDVTGEVDTTVFPVSEEPVTIDVSSFVDLGSPLGEGELVTHTVVFTNSVAVGRSAMKLFSGESSGLPGISLGIGVAFDSIVSEGGGTAAYEELDEAVTWTTNLPPSGDSTLVFKTRADACIPPSLKRTQLNFGSDLAVYNACDVEVGAGLASAAIPFEKKVNVALRGTDLDFPPEILTTPETELAVQLTTPEDFFLYQVSLSSASGETHAGASVLIPMHDGFADLGNPIRDPAPPGATWNQSTRTIEWILDVPGAGSATLNLVAQLEDCRGTIRVVGGTRNDACVNIDATGIVAGVPAPPEEPHLVVLAVGTAPNGVPGEQQVFTYVPGVDPDLQMQLCLPGWSVFNVAANYQGNDIWVGSQPSYHYNPITKQIWNVDWEKLSDTDFFSVQDIAVDPNNGTAYFVGDSLQPLPPMPGDEPGAPEVKEFGAAVRRYDTQTERFVRVMDSLDFLQYKHATVNSAGNIVGTVVDVDVESQTEAQIISVSRGGAINELGSAGMRQPALIAMDGAASMVSVEAYNQQSGWPLVSVSGGGGGFTILADVASIFSGFIEASAVTVDAKGEIYVAPLGPAGLGVVHRQPSLSTEILIPLDYANVVTGPISDMQAVDPNAIPEPPGGMGAMVALLALFGLRAGRRGRQRR